MARLSADGFQLVDSPQRLFPVEACRDGSTVLFYNYGSTGSPNDLKVAPGFSDFANLRLRDIEDPLPFFDRTQFGLNGYLISNERIGGDYDELTLRVLRPAHAYFRADCKLYSAKVADGVLRVRIIDPITSATVKEWSLRWNNDYPDAVVWMGQPKRNLLAVKAGASYFAVELDTGIVARFVITGLPADTYFAQHLLGWRR